MITNNLLHHYSLSIYTGASYRLASFFGPILKIHDGKNSRPKSMFLSVNFRHLNFFLVC